MRHLLTLSLALLATTATADVKFAYEAGVTLYAQFDDASDTCVAMSEGTSLKAGAYTAADSAIATASLPAGTYSARIRIGTAGSPNASDPHVGTLERFVWSGSAETDQLDEILTDTGTTLPATLGTPADTDLATDIANLPTAAETRAEIDSNSTQLAAIVEDTGTTIPATLGTPASDLAADIASLDDVAGYILEDTGTTLPAAIGAGVSQPTALDRPAQLLPIARRNDGVIRSPNAVTVAPGETVEFGFHFPWGIRPRPATASEPTGLTGELSGSLIGVAPEWVSYQVVASDSATDGTTDYAVCEVVDKDGQTLQLVATIRVKALHP